MTSSKLRFPGWQKAVARLSSSQIFWIVSLLFLADLAIPDPIPFVDEILLGLLTVLVARWQIGRTAKDEEEDLDSKPPPKNVTPKPP